MNTKMFGEYGVELCATYFLYQGYQVLRPFGDCGSYDLVVEKDGCFQRIQCKRTTVTKGKYGYPVVPLHNPRSRIERNGTVPCHSVRCYTIEDFDILWVTTPHACYLIPFSDALQGRNSKRTLRLYPKWDRYRVSIPIPCPSGGDPPVARLSPRLNTEDKAIIKRLRKEGRKEQDIADILGVSRSCISVFLSRERSVPISLK